MEKYLSVFKLPLLQLYCTGNNARALSTETFQMLWKCPKNARVEFPMNFQGLTEPDLRFFPSVERLKMNSFCKQQSPMFKLRQRTVRLNGRAC